jgi:putative membrane protein
MPSLFPFSRASFVLDLIVFVMAIVIPIMLFSMSAVRRRHEIEIHRKIQIVLGVALGLAILAFEVDMRIFGWRSQAQPSPYYDTLVFPSLYVHLFFAIPTLFLWAYTISMAMKHRIHLGTEVAKNHRFRHKFFGKLSAYTMMATAVTGWIFYYLAFVA